MRLRERSWKRRESLGEMVGSDSCHTIPVAESIFHGGVGGGPSSGFRRNFQRLLHLLNSFKTLRVFLPLFLRFGSSCFLWIRVLEASLSSYCAGSKIDMLSKNVVEKHSTGTQGDEGWDW